MRDDAARARAGLNRAASPAPGADPRIHADLAHLRSLEGQAKKLRLLPRQPAHSVLNGRHASRLRGRGLNFEELRDYLPGDDVRTIDWKVTARTGEPHVRVYTEERDRPALIVVDQRMSMFFGSKLNMKSVTAAETAAIAAFAILDQGDRVGGIVFGDEMVAEIRPLRSRRTLDALTTAIADANALLSADAPAVEAMGLNRPLEAAQRLAGTNHLIIVVSDFDGIDARTETLLGGMIKHNDVILCLVTDPMAHEIADDLQIVISDGILQAEIDTSSGRVRRSLAEMTSGRVAEVLALEKKLGVPVLPLNAGEATLPQIRRLLGLSAGRP
ncbi:MAG: DUF58 domain-containing protein [Gammaproteobacteria bacterium]|nr:MAG: DUF58 domain-containing protein [Gammaproteobacteria bacterium]